MTAAVGQQLAKLVLQKIAANSNAISTSGDIENLIALANQAHAATEQLVSLNAARAGAQTLESWMSAGLGTDATTGMQMATMGQQVSLTLKRYTGGYCFYSRRC